MKIDSLEKLYVHTLKDIWSAEGQILEVLPRVIEAARDDKLKEAFSSHRDETARHRKRIESIFEGLDYSPGGHRCSGMEGLLDEVKETLNGEVADSVIDAALVAGMQRVEHYEIAAYGVARTLAEKLGAYDAADLLQQSLNEEGNANQHLSRLAERNLNFRALANTF